MRSHPACDNMWFMSDQIKALAAAARKLTPAERAELIEQIWDSIPEDSIEVPIPDWHLDGLRQRLAEHEADPGAVVPWDKVKARLENESRG